MEPTENESQQLIDLLTENRELKTKNQILRDNLAEIAGHLLKIDLIVSRADLATAPKMDEIFNLSISDHDIAGELRTITWSALWEGGLPTLGDIVRKTERGLLRIKNLGKKVGLRDVKEVLRIRGLWLGMTEKEILNWKPPTQK